MTKRWSDRLRRGLGDGLRISDAEYHANINGLNLFFGALLGVVMAGSEGLSTGPFVALLVYTAAIVVTILYVSHSRKRLTYAAVAGGAIYGMPVAMGTIPALSGPLPAHLQPTLAVWLAFAILAEFAPRAPADGAGAP